MRVTYIYNVLSLSLSRSFIKQYVYIDGQTQEGENTLWIMQLNNVELPRSLLYNVINRA